jgi:4-hydroxy-3-methylbut-2-enyl diphosphate reductase
VTAPLVLTPLRIEASAVRRGAPGLRVVVTGAGATRSVRSGASWAGATGVAVAGFCGALAPGLRPGDVVVPDRVHWAWGSATLPVAPLLVTELRRAGLRAEMGPLHTSDRLVRGEERARLAAAGGWAVDMESGWLLSAAPGAARAVVRVVVDTPERELPSRWTASDGVRAWRSLRRAAPVLAAWGDAVRSRRVVVASPRSFCAGVERAIEVVDRALERFGAPLYVRRQIVHNRHVVEDLEARGAVFVDELDEVPDGATVVFSAHGVAPEVRAEAARRPLQVIDATCPLVAKVHSEVRRFTASGYSVVLVGHRDHDETVGTLGEAAGVQLVDDPHDVERLVVADAARVAYVTQTTLATDEVADVIARLRRRFPAVVGPPAADICYASQNRQDAVRRLARSCDVIVVVGSANSSNSNRLVEVAGREGCPAWLVDDEHDLRLEWLSRASTIGVTAGASAPDSLVHRVVETIGGLGPVTVEESPGTVEEVHFSLPTEVR